MADHHIDSKWFSEAIADIDWKQERRNFVANEVAKRDKEILAAPPLLREMERVKIRQEELKKFNKFKATYDKEVVA